MPREICFSTTEQFVYDVRIVLAWSILCDEWKLKPMVPKLSLISKLQHHTPKQLNEHQISTCKMGNYVRCCFLSRMDIFNLCSCTNGVPPRSARCVICSRHKIENFFTITISAWNWPLRCPTKVINEIYSSSLHGIDWAQHMEWVCDYKVFLTITMVFVMVQKQM